MFGIGGQKQSVVPTTIQGAPQVLSFPQKETEEKIFALGEEQEE